jgi:hypothetical protein
MQLSDMAAGSGPPGRTRVICHKTDNLLVQQHIVSELEAAPFKQGI